MPIIKQSAFTFPTFILLLACASEEPSHNKSELLASDAATEVNDNARGESDASAGSPEPSVDSTLPPSERKDAGVDTPSHESTQAPSTQESTHDSSPQPTSSQDGSPTGHGASGPATSEPTSSANPESASTGEGPATSSSEHTHGDLTSDPNAVQWRACGPGQCGTIEVPVDYDDPQGPTLGLRVFVGPATTQRQGVVYFNPGGPGEPVVAFESYEWMYAELNKLMPSMDVVLIDNRGVGDSEPVDCISEAELDARIGDRAINSDLDFFEVFGDYWRGLNDACVSQLGEAKLANFHTANVARDMDRVREVLGEDKINLWMVSYGTVQGSVYAALFPEHVGSFVLDSPAYVGQATNVDDVIATVEAYEHELTRFLDWCALEQACGLGDTSREVKSGYDALRGELDSGITAEGIPLSSHDLDNLTEGAIKYGEWDDLAATLRELSNGNWSALLQEGGDSDSTRAWRFTQTNAIYRLHDYGCPASFSPAAALDLANGLLERTPHFALKGAFLLTQCVGWYTRPSEQRVITKELPSVPLLIITSAHDAATPLVDAKTLQSEFNNGSLMYVSQKEGHGVLLSDQPASDAAAAFITSGNMHTFCDRLPCQEAGAPEPNSSSLRVLTKPTAGVQLLPKLPSLPAID